MTTQAKHEPSEIGGQRMGQQIRHVLEIRAPRETVFDALTTTAGLAGWWTTGAQAETAAVGADLAFTFGGQFNPRMRVVALDRPALVGWEGAGGHDAWGSPTTIRFDLEATGGGTLVRFRHELGRERGSDTVAAANFNWGYYLDSLRLLCETGRGKPFLVGAAGARVGAS